MIRHAALILALLTALNLLNYLDRYVLSAVVAPMQLELHLSNFLAGLLPTVFLIGYFATSPVFGIAVDRASSFATTRWLMALGVAVWSVATVASGLSHATAPLVVWRALVGVGEASFATLAPGIIDARAPEGSKSAWMAIYSAATPIGSALGYLVGGAVAHSHGWRAAFFVAGAPGLVIAVLCAGISDVPRGRPEPRPHARPREPVAAAAGAARELLSAPLYRRTVLGYCVYTFAIGGFAYWAPKYVALRYGMDAGKASVAFGALTVVGGAVGTLLGGFLADRAVRAAAARPLEDATDAAIKDRALARIQLRLSAAGCFVGAPLAALAIAAPSATLFFAATLPCQIAVFLLSGPINVAILRSAPPALRASAMAVAIFGIHALGDLWSPPLIGLASDHAPMQLAMMAIPAVLALAAFVWWRDPAASPRLTSGARVR